MSSSTNYAFLHGGGQGSWVWTELLAALHAQTGGAFGRALVLDAPGCGTKRGRAIDDLTMQDVARELVDDLKAAGMTNVVLVGHSQAGQALPFMAHLRPKLFRRLVYVSCPLPLPGQTVHEMMGDSLHGENEDEVGWPFDSKSMPVTQGFPLLFCNDMDAEQTARFSAQLGKDSWPLKTYSMTDWCYDGLGLVPSTYVICLKDNVLPVRWQEMFANRFKVERLVRIDAGHQVMNTKPLTLAEVLRHETA